VNEASKKPANCAVTTLQSVSALSRNPPELPPYFAESAKAAAKVGVEMKAAFAEERAAGAAFIRAAIEAVRPALPHLSQSINDPAGVHRGVRVAVIPGSVDFALFVTEEGAFAEVGTVRRKVVACAGLSDEQAARKYGPERIAVELLAACDRLVDGNAVERTREARERAERLRALRVLLEDASRGGAR